MNKLIIYGSEYGTTKAYAQKFAELANIPIANYEEMPALDECGLVFYFGALYAGGVKGLKKTVKALGENTKLIIATVGLADVTDTQNTDSIKKSISRQVPQTVLERTRIFHLRGGIDYAKLNLAHKTMMSLLYNKAKNLPKEKQTPEVKSMLETYGKQVDFIDFELLAPILEAVKAE